MKKKITEIRDDIFFRKLLDVSKNAVFIGWSGIHRKEYQSLLLENLPYLRELSIIKNAGFDSTNVSVALYVFRETPTESYISREYDGENILAEQLFNKADMLKNGVVETAKYADTKDIRPKLSDLFQTVRNYQDWQTKQVLDAHYKRLVEAEKGNLTVDVEQNSEIQHSSLSQVVFNQYLELVLCELRNPNNDLFSARGVLKSLLTNIDSLNALRPKIAEFIRIYETEYRNDIQSPR